MKKRQPLVHKIPRIPASIATRYAGKTAAVAHGKVVAGGRNTQEAIMRALKKFPKLKEWDIAVMSIPPRDGVWVV